MEKTQEFVKAISEGRVDLSSLTRVQVESIERVLREQRDFLTKTMDSLAGQTPTAAPEMVKYDKNGQWKVEKAIKPGKPLDYSKMIESPGESENTLNYSEMKTQAKPRAGAGARAKRDKALANAGMSPMKSNTST